MQAQIPLLHREGNTDYRISLTAGKTCIVYAIPRARTTSAQGAGVSNHAGFAPSSSLT